MLNPFRSEAEAYRFLLMTVAAVAVIVVAALIDAWLGVAALVLVGAVVVGFYLRARRAEPVVRVRPARRGGESERRILVIANETIGGEELFSAIQQRAEGARVEVFVVAPALSSRLKTWVSDEDPGRAEAQRRLDNCLARLAAAGISARGEVGDIDPLQAIEDALRTFGADEIVISTHPPGRSNWLERRVVEAARERFALPIHHVIVDLEAERAREAR